MVTALAASVLGWFARRARAASAGPDDGDAHATSRPDNLGERLAIEGPDDEFKRLGDTLDDLLARLEASFEAQRRFVANASHELRTPLTVERTLLQVALADPNASAEQLRAICEELLASGREQERTLEALLTLASSERGLEHREPVDLAALARRPWSRHRVRRRVTASLRARADERGSGADRAADREPARQRDPPQRRAGGGRGDGRKRRT